MYNAPQPKIEDLPTLAQLHKRAVLAVIGAAAVAVMVYLPAEYGKDPTGVGSILGLTEMGEIKQQLAAEAAADEALHGAEEHSSVIEDLLGLFVSGAYAQEAWSDVITFTLEPGQYTEIKATMAQGATLYYAWVAEGGRINFDLHAHSDGQNVTYDKGRGKTEGEGSIETPFAGDHGWFWRNRDDGAVTVTLQLRGGYDAIVRDE